MNNSANTDGVHLELTVEGLGRAAFGDALDWIWRQVDVLFPIITGQWDLMDAILPAGILAGLTLLFRLVLHLADGGRAAQAPRALITAPFDHRLATWRSHEQCKDVAQARAEEFVYGPVPGPPATQPPPAPVKERIEVLDGLSHLAHDLFYALLRFYVHYMAFSIAVCWIFGVGDLDTFFAVVGIGDRS